MSITDVSQKYVEEAVDTLKQKYPDIEVVDYEWEHSPAAYERIVSRVESGSVGGAGVWVINDSGEALLIRRVDEEAWTNPGGNREPNESFAEAGRREVYEETDVKCEITGTVRCYVTEIYDEQDPSRPPVMDLSVTFTGRYCSGTPRPREGEIAEVEWWDRLPEKLLYEELKELPIPSQE